MIITGRGATRSISVAGENAARFVPACADAIGSETCSISQSSGGMTLKRASAMSFARLPSESYVP